MPECEIFNSSVSDKFINCTFKDCIINISDNIKINTSECITCNGTAIQVGKIWREFAHSHECKNDGIKIITMYTTCKNTQCINPDHMEYKVMYRGHIGYQYGRTVNG